MIKHEGLFAKTFVIEEVVEEKEYSFNFTDIQSIKREKLLKEGELNANNELIHLTNNAKFNFLNAGVMVNGKIVTAKVKAKKEDPIPLSDIVEEKVESKYYIKEEKLERWKYLKGAKCIPRTTKEGHTWNYTEGAIAYPDPLDKPARTILTSESACSRTSHAIRDIETGKIRVLSWIAS